MDGTKALGFGKRSTMGCIIASSGVVSHTGRVRADLEVEMSAAALLFEEKDHFRPYLQLSGEVLGIHGEFPGGVTEMRADGKICSVTYAYDLSDEEIADLAGKGLFHEEFELPQELETSRMVLPGTVDYSHIVANGESVFVVSVPDSHMLKTDSLHSGVRICDYFTPQAADAYAKQPAYTSGYYRHVEAGAEDQYQAPGMQDLFAAQDMPEGTIMPDLSQPVEAEVPGMDMQEGLMPQPEAEVPADNMDASNWIPQQAVDEEDLDGMAGDVVSAMYSSSQMADILGTASQKDAEEEKGKPKQAALREVSMETVREPEPEPAPQVRAEIPSPGPDIEAEDGMIGPDAGADGPDFS